MYAVGRVCEQLVDRGGPAPETVFDALEGLEEGHRVLDDLGAGDPRRWSLQQAPGWR